MGYLLKTIKETVLFAVLGLLWALLLIVAFFAAVYGAAATGLPMVAQLIVFAAVMIGSIYLGLRVLGNPITKMIDSVRGDIEHFQ